MRRALVITTALASLLLVSASPIRKLESQSSKPPYRRDQHHGVITGMISFRGKLPARREIDMSSDYSCRTSNPRTYTEDLVVSGRGLANVFVYLKSGTPLDDFSFETPARSAVLDQRGCRYVPHVMGIQTNQTVTVINSDPTTHNVHQTPKYNSEWNRSQNEGAGPLVTSFPHAEVAAPIKCNQHPWMKAYAGVLPHPFFAVSDRKGTFRIEGVPPGNYTLAVWQERLGEKTSTISVGVGSPSLINFEFDGKDYPNLDDPLWR